MLVAVYAGHTSYKFCIATIKYFKNSVRKKHDKIPKLTLSYKSFGNNESKF